MFSYFDRVGDFIKGQQGKWAYAYAAFLGLLSALAMPPYPFIPFYYLSIMLMLLLVSKSTKGRQAFWKGIAFGIGHFGFGLYWVGHSFFARGDVPNWLAPFAVALMVLYLSLYTGLIFFLTRKLWHTDWVRRTFTFAGLFVFAEYLRGNDPFFDGFPWNPTSLIWWPSDSVLQTLSIWGSAGLGLVTLLSAGFMAALFDRETGLKTRIIVPAIGLLVIAGMFGFGWYRLSENQTEFHDGISLRVVQANIQQIEKWDNNFKARNLQRLISLSQTPSENVSVTHIIWPEVAFVWPYEDDPRDLDFPEVREALVRAIGGASLITGANRFGTGEQTGKVFNSIYALDPDGNIQGRYDKFHLVPFGEYLPLGNVLRNLGFGTLVEAMADFDRGPGVTTTTLDGLPSFSPLICYEVVFPDEVILRDDRPEWILNVTNDAWFGISPGPYQHFEMARARAIEEGLPLVRAAGTGISAVVDPYGRVLSKLDLGMEGVIDSPLPQALPPTTYAGKGEFKGIWFVLGMAFVLLSVGAGAGLTARAKREN